MSNAVVPARDVVEPILPRHRAGLPVPITDLPTDAELAVLAEERERDAGLGPGVLAPWDG